MKDLKASINKFNEVTDNITNFVNANKKTIIELKNKNASIINKLEKILTKIKTLMEGEK